MNNNIEKALANFPNDIATFINNLSDERFKYLKKTWYLKYDIYFSTKEDCINFFINPVDYYSYEDFLYENNNKENIEKYLFPWEYINRYSIKSLEKDSHSIFYFDKSFKIKDTIRNEICYLLIEGKETLLGNIYSVSLVYPYNCNFDEVHILPIRNINSSIFTDRIEALNQINNLIESNDYISIKE